MLWGLHNYRQLQQDGLLDVADRLTSTLSQPKLEEELSAIGANQSTLIEIVRRSNSGMHVVVISVCSRLIC